MLSCDVSPPCVREGYGRHLCKTSKEAVAMGVKCRKELPAGAVADATQTPSKVPRKAQSRLQRQFELHECDEM